MFEDTLIIATEYSEYQFHICSKDFTDREDRENIKSFKLKVNEHKPLPRGVATNNEHIFIADNCTHRILKYTKKGELKDMSTDFLKGCCGITIYKDKLYVANQSKGKIEVLDLEFNPVKTPCFEKKLNGPRDVAVDSDGTVYVLEYYDDSVKAFKNGKYKFQFDTDVKNPSAVCVYKKENKKYVLVASDTDPSRVFVFTSSGKSVGEAIILENVQALYGIDVDCDGYIYAADNCGNRVIKFKLHI